MTNYVIHFSVESQKGRHDTQHNDTQHNDIKHNDTQHNDTQHDNKKRNILNYDTLDNYSLVINA